MLFRVVHLGAFGVAVQALMLVAQVMDSRSVLSDRLYRALYTKLLDPQLPHSSKQGMFLSVLFRSMRADPDLGRCRAMAKRLLQVAVGQAVPFLCGATYLVSRIAQARQGVSAEVFVNGASAQKNGPDANGNVTTTATTTEATAAAAASNTATDADAADAGGDDAYDGTKRDPLHARAAGAPLWELPAACLHYHPSVQTFAATLAEGDAVKYRGDPLRDFTLMRFLDRFVFRNPKKKASDHGGSVMQPRGAAAKSASAGSGVAGSRFTVNSKAFVNLPARAVAAEDAFFHKYFVAKQRQEGKRDKKKRDRDDRETAEGEGGGEGGEELSGDEAEAAAFAAALGEDSGSEAEEEMDAAGAGAFDYDNFAAEEEGEGEELGDIDLEAIARAESSSDEEGGGFGAEEEEDEGTSVFASAEEFAHMLEESQQTKRGDRMQQRWESGSVGGGGQRRGGKSKGGGRRKKR